VGTAALGCPAQRKLNHVGADASFALGELKSAAVFRRLEVSCNFRFSDTAHIRLPRSRIPSQLSMKAAVYTKGKSGKVLEIQNLAQPVPKDNEVLLRVRAASINPLDWRLKKHRPGVDVAGEVVLVGRTVTQFKPGDAAFGVCRGAFAEYASAREDKLISKPQTISFEQAAAIPIAGLTALQGLRDKGHLRAGQKVLINGAAGGVGTFAVQIGKSFGACVTGVCSTLNVELVRSLGADRVIDYTREDFTEDPERYDLLLDNAANRSLREMRRILAPSGRCIMAGAPKKAWPVLSRLFRISVYSVFSKKFRFFIASLNRDDLTALCGIIQTGKLTPTIDRRYPLAHAADAVAYVEAGHARAKVVITFD
jgi:NADPH:quinone reductase-like Zn-dependent oxidoreductase